MKELEMELLCSFISAVFFKSPYKSVVFFADFSLLWTKLCPLLLFCHLLYQDDIMWKWMEGAGISAAGPKMTGY